MMNPALVQAEVIDIRNAASAVPSDLVVDANVLYWLFYTNFSSLSYVGGRSPFRYQVTDYLRYRQRATRAKTRFHTLVAILGEFVKAAEYAELETIWLADPASPQPDPANPVRQFSPQMCKFTRYHYSSPLASVRNNVEGMISSVRKSVGLLPQFPTPDDLQNHSLTEWRPSCGDFPDATMIASAKQQSKPHILSDDTDIATFPGITLLYRESENHRRSSISRKAPLTRRSLETRLRSNAG